MDDLKMPEKVTIEVTQQDSLDALITKLPYGYVSRYQWAVLNTDLAKRDGALDACGSLMGRDRAKIKELEEQLKLEKERGDRQYELRLETEKYRDQYLTERDEALTRLAALRA